MPMALVVEARTADSLIPLPVRGALQVDPIEPTSTQSLRLIRSIHFQDAARDTTTALSRTSARVSGYIRRSWIAKLVIWASGNARPMQSPSITGRSSIAAPMNGWMELPPPISSDIRARDFRPRYSAIMVTASAMVLGSVRRSCPTSGAPMLETTATRSSSFSSAASISRQTVPWRYSRRMLSRARYGLPPPPVPRIQAPMAKLSISSGATGLIDGLASESGELLEAHEARDAQDQHQGHPDGEGGHRGRGGIEGVLEIGEQLDGQRGQPRAGQEERQGEVVEGDREGEDSTRHDARLDHAQRHLEERAHRMGAEVLGGLLQRHVEVGQRRGDGADHVRGGHDDVADEHRPVGRVHLEQRVELQQGDPGEDLGQQQRGGHEGVEQVSPAEAPAHQHDGGGGTDRGGSESGPERQLGGQPQRLHELAALEEVGEPAEREALWREREVVARVEGGKHHHHHGQQQEGVDQRHGRSKDHTIPRSARSVTLM